MNKREIVLSSVLLDMRFVVVALEVVVEDPVVVVDKMSTNDVVDFRETKAPQSNQNTHQKHR